MVRAKFRVDSVQPENGGFCIKLSPVTGGSPENDEFYKYTPGGSITLSTINEAAARQFEEGRQFYVDFMPAGQ
jgi:hypothetical protein